MVFNGTLTVPNDDDPTTVKAELDARNKNKMGYCELLLSCTDPVSFACIDDARTTSLPSGDGRKAWDNLKEKFELSNTASKLMLKKEFGECVLKLNEDPDVWIMRLEIIHRKL